MKVKVSLPKQVTVGTKTVDCIFIEYAPKSNIYHFLIHKLEVRDMTLRTMIESMNAIFADIYPCKNKYKNEVNLAIKLKTKPLVLNLWR